MDIMTAFKYLIHGDSLVATIKDYQERRMPEADFADFVQQAKFVKGHQVTKAGKRFVARYHNYESFLHLCLGWYLVLMIFFFVWAAIEAAYIFMTNMASWMVEIKTLIGYATVVGVILFVISMVMLIIKDAKLLMLLMNSAD